MFGIFKKVKETREKMAEMVRIMGEANERFQRYVAMSTEDLKAMPEEELIAAISARTENAIADKDELLSAVLDLPYEQQVFYVAENYEMQLEKGGIWQYLADTSRKLAPYLHESLNEIGAVEQLELFEDFVAANDIDLGDLTNFATFELRKYEGMAANPFAAFDAEYRGLKPISDYLNEYIKNNIEEF